ncbi:MULTISPECIES: hypothetical protein [Pseudomonas syringae group genomosp. 2]|uniref:Uncharacterized protein n=1 Tax=Pseudomonas amygdali pv. mori TaxID=34065 RepID=A0A3M5JHE6_PSEA0|nr:MULTISPECIES: hypothetical protein [Pseudomonas syringae group genomosp. 2]KPX45238.1 Uncharacterized protein ALO69_03371 [Pseudomonas ficuserectae]RMQ44424.1 hypothetical protein ALQ05_200221 [Pseudomonas amygdali pv. mori]RMS33524.1 hypothetical protein ALP67_02643 [Pseudomonas ficuserectae]RMS33825.1 hypothetical protein ALP68_02812 [Pseudomonas ficuserectae]RMT22818.1 hypothetical protein ALP52_02110 [Pseudomonas amygdali pv. mori]
MDSNTNRLTLRLELALLISKARTQDSFYQAVLNKDAPPDRFSSVYWEDVLDKLEDLALMDHVENFTPDHSSYIEDAALLKSYWTLREWCGIDIYPDSPPAVTERL